MIQSNIAATPMSSVVAALGTQDFEDEALNFLHDCYGVEVYSVFRMKEKAPRFLGGASIFGEHPVHRFYGRHSHWDQASFDLAHAANALRSPKDAMVERTEPEALEHRDLRRTLMHFGIVDRVMMCGCSGDDLYGISLLRSDQTGRFEESTLSELSVVAGMLLAVFAKHTSLSWDRPATATGLESIEFIEARLREAKWGLTERELQVSARLLQGVSALGIAKDLGLREDTIATYRKRLYQRLRISCRHELIKKFLALV